MELAMLARSQASQTVAVAAVKRREVVVVEVIVVVEVTSDVLGTILVTEASGFIVRVSVTVFVTVVLLVAVAVAVRVTALVVHLP